MNDIKEEMKLCKFAFILKAQMLSEILWIVMVKSSCDQNIDWLASLLLRKNVMSSSLKDFSWQCKFIVNVNKFSGTMSPCQVEMSSIVCTRTAFVFLEFTKAANMLIHFCVLAQALFEYYNYTV